MLQAKDIKKFLRQIPDNAQVILTDGIITCLFNENIVAFNKFGAEWNNGIGYYSDIVVCGECTHFDCSKCGKETKQVITEDIFQPIPMAVCEGDKKLGTIYPKGWDGNTEVRYEPIKPKYLKHLEKEAVKLGWKEIR